MHKGTLHFNGRIWLRSVFARDGFVAFASLRIGMGSEEGEDEVALTDIPECPLTAMHCAKHSVDLVSIFLQTEQ